MKFIFFGEIFKDEIFDANDSNKAIEYLEKKYYKGDIIGLGKWDLDGEPVVEISAWADISDDNDEECISYQRRPMYLCTEHSYKKLSSTTIKMLTGE